MSCTSESGTQFLFLTRPGRLPEHSTWSLPCRSPRFPSAGWWKSSPEAGWPAETKMGVTFQVVLTTRSGVTHAHTHLHQVCAGVEDPGEKQREKTALVWPRDIMQGSNAPGPGTCNLVSSPFVGGSVVRKAGSQGSRDSFVLGLQDGVRLTVHSPPVSLLSSRGGPGSSCPAPSDRE